MASPKTLKSRKWYSSIGRKGGQVKSDAKTRSSRANALARGGNPRLKQIMEERGISRQWAHELAKREKLSPPPKNDPAPIRARTKVIDTDPAAKCSRCGAHGKAMPSCYRETWGMFCSHACRKVKQAEIRKVQQ